MLTSRIVEVTVLTVGNVDVIRLSCRLLAMRFRWHASEEPAVPRKLSRTVTEAKRSSANGTGDDCVFRPSLGPGVLHLDLVSGFELLSSTFGASLNYSLALLPPLVQMGLELFVGYSCIGIGSCYGICSLAVPEQPLSWRQSVKTRRVPVFTQ